MDVRPARDRAELDAAVALRHAVFVVEQRVPPALERDGRDEDAEHLVAIEDGRVVGTCRLLHGPAETKLGRMAVERAARGRGIAALLLDVAADRARAAGADRIVLDAQLPAMPVYERAGYAAEGDVFLDAGIEHRRMVRRLA